MLDDGRSGIKALLKEVRGHDLKRSVEFFALVGLRIPLYFSCRMRLSYYSIFYVCFLARMVFISRNILLPPFD